MLAFTFYIHEIATGWQGGNVSCAGSCKLKNVQLSAIQIHETR